MTNERKQSALSKARSFKHSKTTSSFFVFNLSPIAGKTSLFHMKGVDFTHFNICCTFNVLLGSVDYIFNRYVKFERYHLSKCQPLARVKLECLSDNP